MARNDARTAAGFFESYRAAFAHGDVAAILTHFAFPCHITGEAREVTLTPIASHELGVHMVGDLLEMYRDVGIATARVLELTTIESRAPACGTSAGPSTTRRGRVYAFEAAYTLAPSGVWRYRHRAMRSAPWCWHGSVVGDCRLAA
jgi:hypothetical protein